MVYNYSTLYRVTASFLQAVRHHYGMTQVGTAGLAGCDRFAVIASEGENSLFSIQLRDLTNILSVYNLRWQLIKIESIQEDSFSSELFQELEHIVFFNKLRPQPIKNPFANGMGEEFSTILAGIIREKIARNEYSSVEMMTLFLKQNTKLRRADIENCLSYKMAPFTLGKTLEMLAALGHPYFFQLDYYVAKESNPDIPAETLNSENPSVAAGQQP